MKIQAAHQGDHRDPLVLIESLDQFSHGPYTFSVDAKDAPRVAEEILAAARRAKENQ